MNIFFFFYTKYVCMCFMYIVEVENCVLCVNTTLNFIIFVHVKSLCVNQVTITTLSLIQICLCV